MAFTLNVRNQWLYLGSCVWHLQQHVQPSWVAYDIAHAAVHIAFSLLKVSVIWNVYIVLISACHAVLCYDQPL